jgi:hypothetical protein
MRQFAKIRENTRASGGITILSSAQFATVRYNVGSRISRKNNGFSDSAGKAITRKNAGTYTAKLLEDVFTSGYVPKISESGRDFSFSHLHSFCFGGNSLSPARVRADLRDRTMVRRADLAQQQCRLGADPRDGTAHG